MEVHLTSLVIAPNTPKQWVAKAVVAVLFISLCARGVVSILEKNRRSLINAITASLPTLTSSSGFKKKSEAASSGSNSSHGSNSSSSTSRTTSSTLPTSTTNQHGRRDGSASTDSESSSFDSDSSSETSWTSLSAATRSTMTQRSVRDGTNSTAGTYWRPANILRREKKRRNIITRSNSTFPLHWRRTRVLRRQQEHRRKGINSLRYQQAQRRENGRLSPPVHGQHDETSMMKIFIIVVVCGVVVYGKSKQRH